MDVDVVDPADEGLFREWFGVLDAARRQDRPEDQQPEAQEVRESLLELSRAGSAAQGCALLARRQGAPAGALRLTLPVRDNTHTAEVQLAVLPSERRRGTGTLLLDEARRRAVAAGGAQLTGEVDEPGPDTAGVAFARARGFACGLVEVRRDLRVPLPSSTRDALLRETQAHSAGYAVRTWQDQVPDDLLEQRAELERRMSSDVPWGEIAHEEEDYDGERIREEERLVLAQGRTYFGAAALDADGRMVAFTDLGLATDSPGTAQQWGTFVSREHRGRRLGLLVKTAVLQLLEQRSPGTRTITTWNAETNTAMVHVNEQLGFRRNGQRSAWMTDL